MVQSGGDAAQAPAHNVRMSDSQLATFIASRIAATTCPPRTSRNLHRFFIGSGVQAVRQPSTEDHRVLDGDCVGRVPGAGRALNLGEYALHLADFSLLVGDDCLGHLLGVGVGAVAEFGVGHRDRAGVVIDHHLQPHPVECCAR
jgi:hypothetical protein